MQQPPMRRAAGGVKDQSGLDKFLNMGGDGSTQSGGFSSSTPASYGRGSSGMPSSAAAPGQWQGGQFPSQSMGTPQMSTPSYMQEVPVQMPSNSMSGFGSQAQHQPSRSMVPPAPSPIMEPGPSMSSMGPSTASMDPGSDSFSRMPKPNKFNKMGSGPESSAATASAAPGGSKASGGTATPMLDGLPPLRRAQFLQIVLRQVKNSGCADADKYPMAEEYLMKCGGDYDKAYQYVKALSEA